MKRLLCALLALLAVFICAACSAAMQTPDENTPTPQTTATPDGGPVSVTEAHADRDTVSTARPAPSAQATAAPAPQTPATGDVPLVPLVGALGLILLCSAGLVMLKRF